VDKRDISDILLWKGVIRYGRNQATYKMALGHLLINYALRNFEKVPTYDVASDFLQFYFPHVRPKEGKPLTRQLKMPRKVSSIEKAVLGFDSGKYTESQAIQFVKDNCLLAPHVVIPRFNMIGSKKIQNPFYTWDENYLYLNDNLLGIFPTKENLYLDEQVLARFNLLQEIFSRAEFADNMTWDEKKEWIRNGANRTNITKFEPALSGYQDDKCFLCGESYQDRPIEVDHLISHDIVGHDEIWNLEITHEFCNQDKSDDIPHRQYIDQIIKRNEAIMASEHPLRQKLELEAGKTPQERRSRVENAYKYALKMFNRPIYTPPNKNNSNAPTEHSQIRMYYDSL